MLRRVVRSVLVTGDRVGVVASRKRRRRTGDRDARSGLTADHSVDITIGILGVGAVAVLAHQDGVPLRTSGERKRKSESDKGTDSALMHRAPNGGISQDPFKRVTHDFRLGHVHHIEQAADKLRGRLAHRKYSIPLGRRLRNRCRSR
jgi:hypothetical protein